MRLFVQVVVFGTFLALGFYCFGLILLRMEKRKAKASPWAKAKLNAIFFSVIIISISIGYLVARHL
jgi:hypothetical protein